MIEDSVFIRNLSKAIIFKNHICATHNPQLGLVNPKLQNVGIPILVCAKDLPFFQVCPIRFKRIARKLLGAAWKFRWRFPVYLHNV